MKKLLFIFVSFLFFSFSIEAQVYKTVTDCTAGGLSAKLTATEKSTVTNLTITGVINSDDFTTIKNMTVLKVLDISGVSISDNKIPDAAFNESSITSITLPNSVTSIGAGAFSYSSLITLTIPNSVISIGEWAFAGCRGLTAITIPNSVISIGECAFYRCENLTGNLVIPASVTSIGDIAFNECGYSSVSILSTNLVLGQYIFGEVPNLKLSVIKVYTSPENLISTSKSFTSRSNSSLMELTITELKFQKLQAIKNFYFCKKKEL